MLTLNHIKMVTLDAEESRLVKHMAHLACVGGKSQIFRNQNERDDRLFVDNLVGQAGSLAMNVFPFKERNFGIELYKQSREIANKDPYAGDSGQDIISTNIDIKTSLIRTNNNQNMMIYNLPVRPREFKSDWIYVLGLIYQNELMNEKITVNMVGWAHSSDFPSTVETKGVFKNAYVLKATQLRPLPFSNDIWPGSFKPYLK